ncbi:MAG: hypothetical protein ACHQUC_04575, partial [Chlamydiales bacterium]
LAWGALVFPQDKILNIIEIKKYLSENLALFASSVRISVSREGADALVFDEGIAPAISEEKNRADDFLAGDRKLTDEVNKAKNLAIAIDELYQALYGQKATWQGETLWQAIAAFKPKKSADANNRNHAKVLQDLYSQK